MNRLTQLTLVAVAALVLTVSTQAETKQTMAQGKVTINGHAVGTANVHLNGLSSVATLPGGHHVAVLLKNGYAVSAMAVDGKGHPIPTTVHTTVEEAVFFWVRLRITITLADGTTVTVTITVAI